MSEGPKLRDLPGAGPVSEDPVAAFIRECGGTPAIDVAQAKLWAFLHPSREQALALDRAYQANVKPRFDAARLRARKAIRYQQKGLFRQRALILPARPVFALIVALHMALRARDHLLHRLGRLTEGGLKMREYARAKRYELAAQFGERVVLHLKFSCWLAPQEDSAAGGES